VNQLRLTIDSDLANVRLVALAVNKICEHIGMSETQASQVELCTAEAVTNAIRHAYSNRIGHEVAVTVKIGENRLDIDVSSGGVSMSKENVHRLVNGSEVFEFNDADIDSLPEGGMGLQIIRQVMDDVSYTTDHQVNHLLMTKFFENPSDASVCA
jgi:serine/threonine-protein kinase RsbW